MNFRGSASVSEIAEALGVSPSAVRRDLEALEREVFLRRSRGGADHRRGAAWDARDLRRRFERVEPLGRRGQAGDDRAARRVILLADHSKFRPPAFFEVARTEVIHDLVTDEGTPEAAIEAMDAAGGLRVHVV